MRSGLPTERGVPPPSTMPAGSGAVAQNGQYAPRNKGALCDKCPLNGQPMVPPELPPHPIGTIVGEGPGFDEVRRGRPFIGKSGKVLDKMLIQAGLKRSTLQMNNATLCQPKTKTPGELTKASKCCAPRLRAEVREPLLILGKVALRILKPGLKSLDAVRGFVLP